MILLISFNEKGNEQSSFKTDLNRDVVMAQDVQSFFSANPASQIRNQVEFWEVDMSLPKIKR